MNYGLDLKKELADQDPRDWEHQLGSFAEPCLAQIPADERAYFMPTGEVQRSDKEDMQDCASRAPVNILEAKFNYLLSYDLISPENEDWLRENGYFQDGIKFSDAFVAINSGTTRKGNSLKAPLEAIRTQGLIPKAMLPLEKWMTWEDYHNPARINPKMRGLGEEFARRFTVNYKRVYATAYKEILEEDMLDLGGYAWPFPDKDGIYQKTGKQANHAFAGVSNPPYLIYDNYIDTHDGDFFKNLAPDYDILDYGYRVYISGEKATVPATTLWQKILLWLHSFFPPQLRYS